MTTSSARPRRRSRILFIFGAIALGIAVLKDWVGCGVYFAPQPFYHQIVTPDVAGGLQRDHDAEGKITDLIAQYRRQLPVGLVDMDSLVYAVYRAPEGDILFIGGAVVNPAGMQATFRNSGQTPGGTVNAGYPGPGGGQGVCITVPVAGVPVPVPECGWVTDDSYGDLFPIPDSATPPAAPSVTELADLVRQMRSDLEKNT